MVLSGALPAAELTGERLFKHVRPLLAMQRLQGRVPVERRRCQVENGVPARLLRRARRAVGHAVDGAAHRLNQIGSALAPASNWIAQLPLASWIAERLLGIDRRRPLPRFERNHFRKWFRKQAGRGHDAKTSTATRGPIVLLDDCLTSYCEPNVNRAAVEVLEAAGYEVHLAGLECCGRTLASKGFLTEAQALARTNVERLLPWARARRADRRLRAELPADAGRRVSRPGAGRRGPSRGGRGALVDSHLVQNAIPLPLMRREKQIVLHGHCHQKALVGAQRHRGRACARSPPTCGWSTPAAAAWPAPSATSITT